MTVLSVLGKVFAQILLDWVRHHLLEHQRPEQSGFTPKISTIDRILALRVLTERRREFRQGCVLVPTLFSTCMDWILGRISERSSCSPSFGNVKISDLHFADDGFIFADTGYAFWALQVLN